MSELDLSPAQIEGGVPWAISGSKGVGKTVLAMGLHGDVTVTHINFDNTALRIRKGRFKDRENIEVFDGSRYIKPTDMVRTGALTIDYVKAIVEKHPADVIVIDPIYNFIECAEAVMRKEVGKTFMQGVERTQWKRRRFVMREMHQLFMRQAKLAVIYVTNEEFKSVMEDSNETDTVVQPRWLDIVEDQVLVLVRVYTRNTAKGLRRYARVVTSKIDVPSTWQLYDISNSTSLTELVKAEEPVKEFQIEAPEGDDNSW